MCQMVQVQQNVSVTTNTGLERIGVSKMCQMVQVQQNVSVITNTGLERIGVSKIKLKVVKCLWEDAYGGKL
jgi:alanine racemase